MHLSTVFRIFLLSTFVSANLSLLGGFSKIDLFETNDPGYSGALIDGVAELNGVTYATDQFKSREHYYRSNDGVNFSQQPLPGVDNLPKVHRVSGGLAFHIWDFIIVTTDGENFYQSEIDPEGSTWIRSVAHLGSGVWLLIMDEGMTQRLWRSVDNGQSWSPVEGFSSTPPGQSNGLMFMVGHDNMALLYSGVGVYRSADSGLSWTAQPLPFQPASYFIQQSGKVYMAAETEIMATSDMGLNWAAVAPHLHHDSFHNLSLVEVSKDGTLFSTGTDYKYYRYTEATGWTVYLVPEDLGYTSFIGEYFWAAGDNVYITMNESSNASLARRSLSDPTVNIGPFRNLYAGDNGYYWSSWFQWFAPSTLPWIYHYNFGWINVPSTSESNLFFYDLDGGWFYANKSLFPYLYSYDKPGWLYADMSTNNPLYFWTLPEGKYITEKEVSPKNQPFDFNAMFGRTYQIKDSIGTHSITFNNPADPAGDGADLVFKYKGGSYRMSQVTLAYVELITGPQILVQAAATLGDNALGSQVQFTLYPDSAFTGEVRYLGYSIMTGGFIPELGGQGVIGNYQPAP